ncbi:hypothetical protein [Pseudomonas asplenii]|uniref:hypothetical protein n=1 Tax=Pseudomonas asplenii TaxID=53407 RepID=UPI00036FE694|nr:hypothetical protein [Pseudomonas fuscovaginae]
MNKTTELTVKRDGKASDYPIVDFDEMSKLINTGDHIHSRTGQTITITKKTYREIDVGIYEIRLLAE